MLSSPTADEAGRLQREPSYLAALLYVSLCPQQAWLNTRSLLPERSHQLRAFPLQVRSAHQCCASSNLEPGAQAAAGRRRRGVCGKLARRNAPVPAVLAGASGNQCASQCCCATRRRGQRMLRRLTSPACLGPKIHFTPVLSAAFAGLCKVRQDFLTLLCNPWSWISSVPSYPVLTSFPLFAERLGCAGGLR